MKKSIVVYYSRSGSNKYLAEKTAKALGTETVPIRPRVNPFPFLLLSSATKLSWGNRKIERDFIEYDSVILCGPIWMGQVVTPLNDFLFKYKSSIKELHFITCCGSKDSTKEEKFGYAHVFRKIEEIMEGRTGRFQAFPIEMVLPEDKKNDDQAMMETRLSDENFKGEILKRFDGFIQDLTASLR